MVCRNVWFRGRFGEGQIPLRSVSDAQVSRVVVAASLLELPRASNGAARSNDLCVVGRLE